MNVRCEFHVFNAQFEPIKAHFLCAQYSIIASTGGVYLLGQNELFLFTGLVSFAHYLTIVCVCETLIAAAPKTKQKSNY